MKGGLLLGEGGQLLGSIAGLGIRRLRTNGGSCRLVAGQAVEADCRVRGNGAPCSRWSKRDQQEATVGVADGVERRGKRKSGADLPEMQGYFGKSRV